MLKPNEIRFGFFDKSSLNFVSLMCPLFGENNFVFFFSNEFSIDILSKLFFNEFSTENNFRIFLNELTSKVFRFYDCIVISHVHKNQMRGIQKCYQKWSRVYFTRTGPKSTQY